MAKHGPIRNTVEPPNKEHFGSGSFALCQRLSPSWHLHKMKTTMYCKRNENIISTEKRNITHANINKLTLYYQLIPSPSPSDLDGRYAYRLKSQ